MPDSRSRFVPNTPLSDPSARAFSRLTALVSLAVNLRSVVKPLEQVREARCPREAAGCRPLLVRNPRQGPRG